MRKITRNIVRAFFAKQPFKGANTRTDGFTVWLHGNEIFRRHNHSFDFNVAGWPTPTTVDRINGLLDGMGACFRLCRSGDTTWAFPIGSGCRLTPKDYFPVNIIGWHNVREVEAWLNNKVHYANKAKAA